MPASTLPPPRATLGRGNARLRFFLGDCLTLLPLVADASIDVVVTSPPYNLGIRYRTYDDARPREEYLAWVRAWASHVARVLKPQGSFFLNVGSMPSEPWAAFDVAQAVRPVLRLQNTLHWIKSIALDRDAVGERAGLDRGLAVGHYKPLNSRRFVNDCHEFVFHFSPEGRTPLDRLALGVPYQDRSNIGRWKGAAGGLRCRGNTWFLPYETISRRERDRPHPATFPVRLPEFCLRLHGLSRASAVLDPFLGIGHTAAACARLGLSCDGFELDAGYLDEAVARVRELAAETADRAATAPPIEDPQPTLW
jgi:site-specific DNA-methyltransferase (adenine-specific)